MKTKRSRKLSLQNKITVMIVVAAAILSALAVTISTIIYCKALDDRYISICNSALKAMEAVIPEDDINGYLAEGAETAAYAHVEQQLETVKSCFPDVTYLYVYQIRADGCYVVFDLDTPDLTGGNLGDLVCFDESFMQYIPALRNGEEIAPIISNDQYGWLLSVYRPLKNHDGRCVAYAAVDISMIEVRANRYVFVIRMLSLLTGATILITAFAIWFAQQRLAGPINSMAKAAGEFAFEKDEEREESARQLEALEIHTGDEIENLCDAIVKMMKDVASYVGVINEKSRDVANKAATIQQMQNNIIISFANMIENRDENTGSHVRHTASFVSAIGSALYRSEKYQGVLTVEYLDSMERSAPLHDIGKIKIPDGILNKPGRLTPEEFETIKTHTTAGKEILQSAMAGIESENYLHQATDMAAHHHERWDGTGYPGRLSGEQIPLCARIMAVADVFDALISRRSYKPPMPFDEAVRIIQQESGTHFDPAVVDAFMGILDEIRRISENG